MDIEQQRLYKLAGDSITESVNLGIKLFCLEQSKQQLNSDFDECYQRLRFLNFQYFNKLMNQLKEEDRIRNERNNNSGKHTGGNLNKDVINAITKP